MSPRLWTVIAVALFNILVAYGLVQLIAPGRVAQVPLPVVLGGTAVVIVSFAMAIRGWKQKARRRSTR